MQQNGRSMVEMLGVLAVIGILSVGALAGFNKAMTKHKLNQHLDGMNKILLSSYEISQKLPTDTGWTLYSDFLKNTNSIPDDFKYVSKQKILDNFQNQFYFYRTAVNTWGIFYYMNADEASALICSNLLLLAKENSHALYTVSRSTQSTQDDDYRISHKFYGHHYCKEGVSCLDDLTVAQIVDYCNYKIREEKTYNFWIEWK